MGAAAASSFFLFIFLQLAAASSLPAPPPLYHREIFLLAGKTTLFKPQSKRSPIEKNAQSSSTELVFLDLDWIPSNVAAVPNVYKSTLQNVCEWESGLLTHKQYS